MNIFKFVLVCTVFGYFISSDSFFIKFQLKSSPGTKFSELALSINTDFDVDSGYNNPLTGFVIV